MWSYVSPKRRKSSSSSQPRSPISPTSPTSPSMSMHPKPYFSSALVESPEVANSPRFDRDHTAPTQLYTPAQLGRVEEDPKSIGQASVFSSTGSHAPLLSRDFATRPMADRIEEKEEQDAMDNMVASGTADSDYGIVDRDVPNLLPPPPPRSKTKTTHNEMLIPPSSVHDAYVSTFITPMGNVDGTPTQPPTPDANGDRPPILRTTSAPGNPTTPSKLLPSPLSPRQTDKKGAKDDKEKEQDDGTPIFDIFNADMSEQSHGMVRALKGHLEEVLKVQEEVGRMHLALERLTIGVEGTWGRWEEEKTPERKSDVDREASSPSFEDQSRRASTPTTSSTPSGRGTDRGQAASKDKADEAERALLEREKGVDEIMEKLGTLSERLRTYHTLGTPRLSFPNSPSVPFSPVREIPDPLDETPNRNNKTRITEGISPPHAAVANLRGHAMPPSPLSQVQNRLDSRSFSGSMTTLDETETEGSEIPYGYSGHVAEPESYSTDQEESRVKNGAKRSDLSPLSLSAEKGGSQSFAGWTFGGTSKEKEGNQEEESWVETTRIKNLDINGPRRKSDGRKWMDSPLEAIDRSRPW